MNLIIISKTSQRTLHSHGNQNPYAKTYSIGLWEQYLDKTVTYTSNTNSLLVTGLAPNTSYSLSVTGLNAEGQSNDNECGSIPFKTGQFKSISITNWDPWNTPLNPGDAIDIEWYGTVSELIYNIYYSSDSGKTWVLVQKNYNGGNYAEYEWFVPANSIAYTNNLIKIAGVYDPTIFAISPVFSIVVPPIKIVKPVANQMFIAGDSIPIVLYNSGDTIQTTNVWIGDNNEILSSIEPNINLIPHGYDTVYFPIPNNLSDGGMDNIDFEYTTDGWNTYTDVYSDSIRIINRFSITSWEPKKSPLNPGDYIYIGLSGNNITNLYYSADSGKNWKFSTNKFTSDNNWFMPLNAAPSANYLIKLFDVNDSAVSAISPAFSVVIPPVTVVKPIANQIFVAGDSIPVVINNSGDNLNNVSVNISGYNEILGNFTPNIGVIPHGYDTIYYPIPGDLSMGGKEIIDFEYSTDGWETSSDAYSDTFNVLSKILITDWEPWNTPLNPGDEIYMGWSGNNVVNLFYSADSGTHWISGMKNISVGSYNWVVPKNAVQSNKYLIKLVDVTDSANYAISQSFSVDIPPIKIVNPKANQIYRAGDRIPLVIYNLSDTIKNTNIWYDDWISDYGVEQDNTTIPKGFDTLYWPIPSDMPSGGNDFFNFEYSTDNWDTYSDIYSDTFRVVSNYPAFYFVKPVLDEQVKYNSIYPIEWFSTDVAKVKLEYFNPNNSTWNLIADSLPVMDSNGDPSVYNWHVPSGTVNVNGYKIRFTNEIGKDTSFVSDIFGLNTSIINILHPAGNEVYKSGDTIHVVYYVSENAGSNLNLFNSFHGTWNWLTDTIPGTVGIHTVVYRISASELSSNHCQFGISASNDTSTFDGTYADFNNVPFIICSSLPSITSVSSGSVCVSRKCNFRGCFQ